MQNYVKNSVVTELNGLMFGLRTFLLRLFSLSLSSVVVLIYCEISVIKWNGTVFMNCFLQLTPGEPFSAFMYIIL